MNRLTDYNNILNEVNFEVPSDREGAYNILDIARYSDEEEKENILLSIADRLLAYEDTDLEPEQIDELNKMLLNDQIRHGRALDKLLEYQKLEKQGLLIKLPCKVGDIFYINIQKKTYECKISGFYIIENEIQFMVAFPDKDSATWFETGETHKKEDLFLTREEAEKALNKEE